MNEKVSIIILNYNGLNLLKNCLESIKKQTYSFMEIILVDNGSQDNSVQFIKEKYPEIIIIENKKNLGFCKGNNKGVKKASGEYLFLLNNDTVLDENCILNLIEEIKTKPSNCIGVFPKLLFKDAPLLINAFGVIWNYKNHWRDNRVGLLDLGQFNFSEQVFGSLFSAVLFKKNEFIEIGMFDENFFCYGEDFDVSYRANILGYVFYTSPQSIVYHQYRASSGDKKNPEYSFYLFIRNYFQVFIKNYEWINLKKDFKNIISFYYLSSFNWYIKSRQYKNLIIVHLRVLLYYIFNIRNILKERKKIQKKRKVRDIDVWNFSSKIGQYNIFHYDNSPVISLKNFYTAKKKIKETYFEK
ncbi:MAG: glycosyltransferase family 2 protein [bacterium]